MTTNASVEFSNQDSETRITVKRTSKHRLILRRFCRNKQAVIGVVIVLLMVFYAIFAKYMTEWAYDEPDFLNLKQPPSAEHWLGTDIVGGDLFVLSARGLGRSLMIGFIASIGITVIAAFVGAAIAYVEGWSETIGTWILDMLLVVPTFFLLAIMVSKSTGTSGWIWLTFALMLFGWIGYARVLRSIAQSLRDREYVAAARYMGVKPLTILWRHMIPNLGSILIIHTVLGVVYAVEAETGLSFIGFGITPPDTSLGVLIKSGSATLMTAPWMFLTPALLLLALCYSMTKIGDGLRDALDPSSESGGKA
ncbi:ABC transporter permease [Arthrobacter rhombi]|uniref:Oligopeptide transport system permease protein OppC n=1 Tax=Arthrobacter rhombi TaxID=71253 RepID=A0A1R4FEF5_9MICC|nr:MULTISPECIES: ABC transporter permease [Micrococcaceae]PCC24781.1 ABC transporter permease [Glutamicibacter sp. BW78]SJM54370.1 Oligopeptide transport system permease protein OppC (TC 3.A.1.5.1) [Arthrobacter rhombi]